MPLEPHQVNHSPPTTSEGDFDEASFDTQREIKRERKRIAKGDRSKYKKTDWDKRPLARSLPKTGELEGLVVRTMGDLYFVQLPGAEHPIGCTLRGALKKEFTQSKNLVVVGDQVLIHPYGSGEGVICAVLERKSVLFRADNLSRRKRHLMAANVEWALIVTSVMQPPLKASFLDRCIIAAQKGGMKPLIAINKTDLLQAPAAKAEAELLQELQQVYADLEIPIIALSTYQKTGLVELEKIIGTGGAAAAGQSGVGKTSILNALTGQLHAVAPVRRQTGKGVHTTTHAQLIPLATGGWIIDTPGVRSFGIWNLEPDEVESYFGEILEVGARCRFTSCTHLGEDGCALPEALELGEISILRYQSYATLREEMSTRHLRR